LKGKFITFEGIDGSGKSTQLRSLEKHLRSRGVDLVVTREPGGTALGRQLRAAFLETKETVAPMAELLSFAADRAQHVEHLVKPSIAAGKVVISDRYADATYAYQGERNNISRRQVNQVIALATGGFKPDLTLFFDIPVDVAIRRMAKRPDSHAKKNRMDEETAEFYTRVRKSYMRIAKREPTRFKVIDADRPVEEIHADVVKIVTRLIK
jgi:dTMP kinase